MGIAKATGIIKPYNEEGIIVGAWLSQKKMDQIGVKMGDFIYVQKGWSGSLSCRAVVKGTLPSNFDEETIALTDDRIQEGNFTEGDICNFWKHTSWF
ncbi:hypothetical protein [Sinanaerobacter chloroacetimidivorans]|nr:hypothetical protein [Sinanaerobacter chloroacetimidivorans]